MFFVCSALKLCFILNSTLFPCRVYHSYRGQPLEMLKRQNRMAHLSLSVSRFFSFPKKNNYIKLSNPLCLRDQHTKKNWRSNITKGPNKMTSVCLPWFVSRLTNTLIYLCTRERRLRICEGVHKCNSLSMFWSPHSIYTSIHLVWLLFRGISIHQGTISVQITGKSRGASDAVCTSTPVIRVSARPPPPPPPPQDRRSSLWFFHVPHMP